MEKKGLLKVAVIVGLFFIMAGHLCDAAAADDYPKGPVKFLVPYNPGGSSDNAARILQPYLEKELKVPVIVENRPGAGGEVCATYLHREPPDGYKFMTYFMPDLALVCIKQTPVFKFEDLDPMVSSHSDFNVILVKKDSPLNSLADLLDEAKKNPGKISISATHQAAPHILAIYLKKQLKIDLKIVPYKGGGDAVTAAIGGHVTANWGDGIGRLPYRDQLKAIAVSTKEPHSAWPEGKPINDQLKPYGISIPDINTHRIVYVRAEFKQKYPERYEKLRQAFLNASQAKEYLEMEKKQKLDLIRLWGPGNQFEKGFKEQYEFLSKNKDIFKED